MREERFRVPLSEPLAAFPGRGHSCPRHELKTELAKARRLFRRSIAWGTTPTRKRVTTALPCMQHELHVSAFALNTGRLPATVYLSHTPSLKLFKHHE